MQASLLGGSAIKTPDEEGISAYCRSTPFRFVHDGVPSLTNSEKPFDSPARAKQFARSSPQTKTAPL